MVKLFKGSRDELANFYLESRISTDKLYKEFLLKNYASLGYLNVNNKILK